MQKYIRYMVAALAALFACPLAAYAHHSLSAYVRTNTTLTGAVSEFHFVHPHPYLILKVAAPAGDEVWKVELDERNEFEPLGMRKDTYRQQDKVIVTGWPGRPGEKIMYMRRLERPSDGLIWEQVGNDPRLVSRGSLGS